MADKDTTPAEQVDAEMAKKSARSGVATYALWCTCSEADAEDLVTSNYAGMRANLSGLGCRPVRTVASVK